MDNPFKSPVILSLCTGMRGIERGIESAIESLWPEGNDNANGTAVQQKVHSITVAAYVEIEAFVTYNLVRQMEQGVVDPVPVWTDLKTFPAGQFHGQVDGIIGGYPCQPFSLAGKLKGTDDPRHLWPFIAGHIRAIQPVWCFFENVANHLNIGYRQVRQELEELGYTVKEGIFSAEEVGATHRRERLFILAIRKDYVENTSSAGIGHIGGYAGRKDWGQDVQQRDGPAGTVWASAAGEDVADPQSIGKLSRGHEHGKDEGSEPVRNELGRVFKEVAPGGFELGNAPGFNKQHERDESGQSEIENRRSSFELGNTPGIFEREQTDESKPFAVGGEAWGKSGDAGQTVADTNSSGQQQSGRAFAVQTEQLPTERSCSFTGWPAGQGSYQHPWEEPRTVEPGVGCTVDGYNFRDDLLRLYGNGVVSKVSSLAFIKLLSEHYYE